MAKPDNEPTMVVQRAYEWTLWVIPKVEKFPRSQRYAIGEHLVRASLDLLLHLVDATYQVRNSTSLLAAGREVNRIRYLLRLAKDLRLLTLDSHEFSARALDEIGRMTGGWRRSARG